MRLLGRFLMALMVCVCFAVSVAFQLALSQPFGPRDDSSHLALRSPNALRIRQAQVR